MHLVPTLNCMRMIKKIRAIWRTNKNIIRNIIHNYKKKLTSDINKEIDPKISLQNNRVNNQPNNSYHSRYKMLIPEIELTILLQIILLLFHFWTMIWKTWDINYVFNTKFGNVVVSIRSTWFRPCLYVFSPSINRTNRQILSTLCKKRLVRINILTN